MIRYFIFAFICSSMMILACQSNPPKKAPLNPNGDSELALLMRKMFEETKKMMEAKESGEKYIPALDVAEILTAHPTEEGKNMTPEYQIFARQYMQVMENYQRASLEEINTAYDAVVTNCKSCHQAICPGPLRRIVHLE